MNAALAHPGYIALKASLAALLALAVVHWLDLPDRLSASFVAVVCISPTVYSGVRRGLEQIGASAIGGSVTFALALLLPPSAVLGLSLFLAIWLSFVVGLARGFLVAAFTVLYVLILPGSGPFAALEHRLGSVAIGVASAIVLNLAVSALTWNRVFTRRLTIARHLVSEEWAALSRALLEGAEERARRALFERCFGLLRTLFEELADATRESRLLARGSQRRLEDALTAAHQLLAVAHYGKDLALLLDRDPGPFPAGAAYALELSAALREGKLVSPPEAVEAKVQAAQASAALAWRSAQEAEARFAG